MTGPEHYRRAEELAAQAMQERSYPETSYAILAQVHATLALTAATAAGTLDRAGWIKAVMTTEEDKTDD
jgi:hypothetical protein